MRIVVLCWFVLLSCSLAYGGLNIFLTTEKAVYPFPLEDEIQIMGYMREVPAGTPVDISVSLTLPDGNVTWLTPELEFHPGETEVLEQFPFVAVPVAELFKTDGSKIFDARDEAYGDLPPGRYVLKSRLQGGGVDDSSESVFFLVSEELLPSIAETPRPIIDELEPAWGYPGSIITIRGRNLRGMPELVEPALIDRFQIKVTLAGQEVPIVDMDDEGSWIDVQLPPYALSGDMIVNITLPYWDLIEPDDQLLIPRVASYASNAFPFWVSPEITGTGSSEGVMPGATVTFTGRNFSENVADNQVFFNGIPGTVTDATETTLTVVVPVIPAEQVLGVQVVSNGIAGPLFYVWPSAVRVTNWYPRTLIPGDTLYITGSGFSDTLEENWVFIGGVPQYVSSATATSLAVETSLSLQSGIMPLEVVVRGFSVNISDAITVVPVW
jgi:hypothetical protein